MRFCFCGEQDCPDWVLAEIATLSKITSIKMKLLCTQVAKDILGQPIDYAKVYQLTSDAKFETGDVKACIAVLHFILCNAAKHNVHEEILANEIQQLGLPKEHSIAICKLYGDNLNFLQTKLRAEVLRLSYTDSIQWRVNYLISSSQLKESNTPTTQFRVVTTTADSDKSRCHSFSVSPDKLQVLLGEMKQLLGRMEELE